MDLINTASNTIISFIKWLWYDTSTWDKTFWFFIFYIMLTITFDFIIPEIFLIYKKLKKKINKTIKSIQYNLYIKEFKNMSQITELKQLTKKTLSPIPTYKELQIGTTILVEAKVISKKTDSYGNYGCY